MNKQKYKIYGLPNPMAFPFKYGKFSSLEMFQSSPNTIHHFALEENALVTVYRDVLGISRSNGWIGPMWLMYDDKLGATHLSGDAPEKYNWLIPVCENYSRLWSDVNQTV